MSTVAGELEQYAVVRGPADGPAVVFVHGLGASSQVWEEQATRLADRYRVVCYDLRAHGASGSSESPCTRSDLARDLVRLLDAQGIERAALVGHSAGGVVAMQTAVDHPARLWGLVLVGSASECNERAAAWYARSIEKGLRDGGEAVMRAMGMDPDKGPAPDGRGFAPVAEAMRSLHDDPLTGRLRGVDVPTLIVVGEKDFLGVGGSVILSRTIAGSELEIVEGRGHGIYLEDPEGFARRLRPFLERHHGLPATRA